MERQVQASKDNELAGNLRGGKEFNRSLMIQRLGYPNKRIRGEHPFGPFGAGGSGLNDKAYLAVNRIFSFDYMGDANYEYGKMQETMAAIYDYGKNGNLVRGKVRVGDDEIFYISHRDIEDDVRKALNTIATHDHLGLGNWIHSRDWIGLYEALKERREHPGKVKRLGQSREDAEHLKELIKNGKDPRLVEANSKVLRKLKEDIDWTEANQERPRWRAGGIELNNQFLFFIEQPMWEKMSKLLRVDVAAKAQKQ